MKLIQRGNKKLHNCMMFNLPAATFICGRLCPSCYAYREQLRYPKTLKVRIERYYASLKPDFAQRIISELLSLKKLPRWFRIHASGDFYSQEYINAWVVICSRFPTIGFYAYTKRLADFDFSQLRSLKNVAIINSYHFGRLNYGSLSEAPLGAFICPSSKTIRCGIECTYCHIPGQADTHGVYFLKH